MWSWVWLVAAGVTGAGAQFLIVIGLMLPVLGSSAIV